VHEIAGKLDQQPSRVVKYWYDLGLELKIKKDDLDLIERGNNCNPAEKLLLHAYTTLEPEKATAGEFRRIIHSFQDRRDLHGPFNTVIRQQDVLSVCRVCE